MTRGHSREKGDERGLLHVCVCERERVCQGEVGGVIERKQSTTTSVKTATTLPPTITNFSLYDLDLSLVLFDSIGPC